MTRGNNDYNKAKIYKLVDGDGYFYIGHSCTLLTTRLAWHKNAARQHPERSVYKRFNDATWQDVRIILICDDLNVENMEQLLREEDAHIRMHSDDPKCLNNNRAKITREEKNAYRKKYRNDHTQEESEYKKQYRDEHKDQISERGKQYYQENKATIAEKHKQHREENKERITAYKSGKIECPNCGCEVQRTNICYHKRSQKCRQLSDAKTV